MTTRTDLLLLASSIKVGLFADRETIEDAMAYAWKIAQATDAQPAVLTALHVVLNTVAKKIEAIAELQPRASRLSGTYATTKETTMKTFTDYQDIPADAAYLGSEDGSGTMDCALADAIERADSPARLRDDDGTYAYFDLGA